MGVSSDAMLFYGFSAEDEDSWEEIFDGKDWDEAIAEKKGLRAPEVDYSASEENKEIHRAYWAKKVALLADEPCVFNMHCSDSCSILYVCIRESEVVASRGEAVEVKTLTVNLAWDGQLKAFCDLMGIPWQQPRWYLVSYMG